MSEEREQTKRENRQRLIGYFEDSCHDTQAKILGVEVEHFVVMGEDGTPVAYEPAGQAIGISDVLTYLSKHYTAVFLNNEGEIIGCADEKASITLEPASQIEISIAPFSSIATIGEVYAHFRSLLDGYLEKHGARLYAQGYHPTRKAEELTLIPKDRYRCMDAWFAKLGTEGKRMMRASASTQVSIDFSDERDAVRKLRLSSALTPVLSAIADNAPVFEREPATQPLQRLDVWRNVDPDRAGVIPGVFEPGYSFARYADWLLGTSPIFVTRPAAQDEGCDGGASNGACSPHAVADATKKPVSPEAAEGAQVVTRPVGDTTAAEAYADARMTQADIEHLLSMYWPDVRLKRYVEIRPADSLPQPLLLGYVALIKGIFYSPAAMDALERQLGVHDDVWPFSTESVEAAADAIREKGYQALVYGTSLEQWIETMFDLAKAGLDADEQPYLEPLRAFALSKPLYHRD